MGKSKDLATLKDSDLTLDTDTFHVDLADNRVGIGTTTPVHDLQIHKATASSQARIQMTTNESGATNADGYAVAMEAGNRVYHWLYENAPMQFATNNTLHMTINANGAVTMPKQPSVSGRSIRPVSTAGYANLNVNLYFNDIQHNNGNHWNNSTGVWTCPVAGRYWVFVSILIDDNMSNGNVARYEIRKNGSEFFRGYDQSYNSGSTYGGMIASGGIFNCSANDTITVVGTNGTLHTGAESTFTICLLG